MLKSKEFEKLCAYWDELKNFENWARNETWRARDEAVMFIMNNRALIARSLRTQEMAEKSVQERCLTCGACGHFFSGDPPTSKCRSRLNGKHKLLLLIDLEDFQEALT